MVVREVKVPIFFLNFSLYLFFMSLFLFSFRSFFLYFCFFIYYFFLHFSFFFLSFCLSFLYSNIISFFLLAVSNPKKAFAFMQHLAQGNFLFLVREGHHWAQWVRVKISQAALFVKIKGPCWQLIRYLFQSSFKRRISTKQKRQRETILDFI